MNRYRMRFAPQAWTPSLSPTIVRLLSGIRQRQQKNRILIDSVETTGQEIVRSHLKHGDGVMIMPNHSSHADPYVIYSAADQIGTPLHVMATWHVFHDQSRIVQWLLRRHGCFSVDREANDIGAFRLATTLLHEQNVPLVVFPEGEIYHCNDRVTPFREGAAAIAVTAARKANCKIVCIPCAIKYQFDEDPTSQLEETMGRLEEAILWRRQDGRPLHQRIYRFAEALLSMKELEYFDRAQEGPLPDRIRNIGDHILSGVEIRHELNAGDLSIPERVKQCRRTIIGKLEQQTDKATQKSLNDDLEDLFLVVQSFSYPGDYVREKPSIERMAETIDKFEEDVLGLPTATIRARRKARVRFGDAIEVSSDRKQKGQSTTLTSAIESSVQKMLDEA